MKSKSITKCRKKRRSENKRKHGKQIKNNRHKDTKQEGKKEREKRKKNVEGRQK